MKILFTSLLLFLITQVSQAQMTYEIGGQKNFLASGKAFNGVKSYSAQLSQMLVAQGFPVYGGVTLHYIYVKDELITANKYSHLLPGVKAGMRPLAKWLIIPVQPFVEGFYTMSIIKKEPAIKKIYGWGGGLEIYYSKRSAIALYFGFENYEFATKQKAGNQVARVSLRFNSF